MNPQNAPFYQKLRLLNIEIFKSLNLINSIQDNQLVTMFTAYPAAGYFINGHYYVLYFNRYTVGDGRNSSEFLLDFVQQKYDPIEGKLANLKNTKVLTLNITMANNPDSFFVKFMEYSDWDGAYTAMKLLQTILVYTSTMPAIDEI